MEQPTEKVISTIKKLLSLANNNPSEAEASAAMAKAQDLLLTYNLQMAEINASPDSSTRNGDGGKRAKEKYQRSCMFAYQRQLWSAIAKVNYCWYESTPVYKENSLGVYMKVNYHHYLIGSEANVIITKMMGDYLEDTINKLCPYKPGRDSSKSLTSWKEGCTMRLCERLEEKKYDMERASERHATEAAQAGSTCTALTLRNVQEYEDDQNYRAIHGDEEYFRYISYRHNDKVCECKYCTQRREYREQCAKLAANEPEPVAIPESEAARQRRLKKEAEDNAKWNRRWRREREREEARNERAWAKKDATAFRSGIEKAEEIGLDSQVASSTRQSLK